MITDTGGNLGVVILTKIGQDWQTFATWYSLLKNLPDSKVIVGCLRTGDCPFQLYQWAKRLGVFIYYYNPPFADPDSNFIDGIKRSMTLECEALLVLRPLTMAIDSFNPDILQELNSRVKMFWTENGVALLKNVGLEDLDEAINRHELSGLPVADTPTTPLIKEAKDTENLFPLVSYDKGCGRWIDKLKGCPFSNAAGLVSDVMTVNENRIIELWKKIVPLYSITA